MSSSSSNGDTGVQRRRMLLFVVMSADAKMLGLDKTTKPVLEHLINRLNYQKHGLEVFPGNRWLADKIGYKKTDPIAQAKLKLHELGLIKMSRDRGKSDHVTINEDYIRSLCEPRQIAAKPTQKSGGYPPKNQEGQPAGEAKPPPQKTGGSEPVPTQKSGDHPPKNRVTPTQKSGDTHPKIGTDNLTISSDNPGMITGGSAQPCPNEQVQSGPHQRKLPVHGLVASAVERTRSPCQDDPSVETPDQARADALRAAGARRGSEG